ncbi:MAG: DMT family transporter [Pseudomonadota bacterium]
MVFGLGELYSLAAALCWAVAVILLKKSGESLPPFALNLIKNGLCLAALGTTLLVLGPHQLPHIPPVLLVQTLVSGALGIAVADTLYFRALNAIGAARMGVIGTAYSPGVILLAALLLGERLSPLQLGGVALTLAGIVLVTYAKATDALDAAVLRQGALLGVLSVLLMAVGVILAKPVLETQDFLWVVFLRVAAGVALMLGIATVRHEWSGLAAAYRGVRHWPAVIAGSLMSSYVALLFWLAGYKYADASIAAVINELAAIFIVGLAAWLLRERVTRRQLAGGVLALTGVLVVVLMR